MKNSLRLLSLAFAAGVFGGLINRAFIYFGGSTGIAAAIGINIAPAWTPDWLYQSLVWGGIWGLLLLLPLWKDRVWMRGFIFGLAPSLVQLLVVFPSLGAGAWGLALGTLTPVWVIIANTIWGWCAAHLYHNTR